MKYVWAAGSDVGLVRDHNEDTVYPDAGGSGPGPVTVAVADGMGGHVGGEVASRVAIDAAIDADEGPVERLVAANDAVVSAVEDDPSLAGMGTTMSLASFGSDGSLDIGHVGDSRIYRLRDGELSQLTSDHTFVAELLEAGRITADEAVRHPKRHFLTRAVGTAFGIEIEHIEDRVEVGDRILLCSDGLTDMLDDNAIGRLLGASETPEDAVWTLIEAANRAGGLDNTSVVVVEVRP